MNNALTKSGENDGSQDALSVLNAGNEPGSAMPPMMDALQGGQARRSMSLGPVMMVAAVVAAGGLLFGMRQMGLGPKFTLAGGSLDTQVPEQNKSLAANQEILMAELGALRTSNQVKPDQVRKNPFTLAYVLGQSAEAVPVDPNDPEAARKAAERGMAERLAKAKAERAKNLEIAFKELQLQGVLGGSRPVARINGNVFRVGDTVAKYFTVKSIHGRSVELDVDGEIRVIEIGDENTTGPSK